MSEGSPNLIGVGETIETRGLLLAAKRVELHVRTMAPPGHVFVIRPNTMAHWFGGLETDVMAVVVNPDTQGDAQHVIDYLLEGIDFVAVP